MFDDLRQTTASGGDRRRVGPFVAAAILYGLLAAGAIAATAYVKTTVDDEQLAQVTFAPRPVEATPEPPPPPPPPSPPPPVARPRPAAQRANAARGRPRAVLEAPTEIPRERLDESDRALADAPVGDPGDVGTDDGTGDAPENTAPPRPAPHPAPPPPPTRVVVRPVVPVTTVEHITVASVLPGNRPPTYPEEARRSGLQGIVLARVSIDEGGHVVAVQILRGEDAFHDVVRTALLAWRYSPARDGEGQSIPSTKIVRIPFRLAT